MRKLLWLVLFMYAYIGEAQIVESTCEAPDSIQAEYEKDAAYISLKNQWANGSAISSIFPDPILKDSILNAMMAVYNARDLEQRNEVIALYNIHANYQRLFREYIVFLNPDFIDDSSQIFDSLSNLTGNDFLDEAIDLYDLSLIDISWDADSSLLEARIQAKNILNIDAVIEEVNAFQGVVGITTTTASGGADRDILYESTRDYVDLTYIYRWGDDCLTNCEFEHSWTFRIYPDCSVELVTQAGDALAVTNLRHLLSIALFPNPTPDQVSVNLVGPPQLGLQLQLYNAVGQLISISEMPAHSGLIKLELSLSELPIGVYFLSITNGDSILTEKLVKK